MTLSEKRDKLGELAKRIFELRESVRQEDGSDRSFSAEEQANWDRLNEDYSDLRADIDREERDERIKAIQADQTRIVNNPELRAGTPAPHQSRAPQPGRRPDARARNTFLRSWFRYQLAIEIPDEDVRTCQEHRFRYNAPYLDINLRSLSPRTLEQAQEWVDEVESRAQSVGTDSEGGYTRPEGFVARLERALLAFGGTRAVAEVMRTATGKKLPWPTLDSTTRLGRLLAENTAITEDALTFSEFVLDAYKYSSDSLLVSAELLEDNEVNLEAIIPDILGESIARQQSVDFTTGDGSAKPNGIVTASTLGKTTAINSAITADEIIDLYHSVDPRYRTDPSVGWMMNDATVAVVRKLKDTTNQYLWQPGMQAGQPDRLLGRPITVNQQMASIATTAKVMLFGQLNKYKIRDVKGIRLRHMKERYADNDQDGFVSFLRSDGDLLDAGTAPVKHMAMAV